MLTHFSRHRLPATAHGDAAEVTAACLAYVGSVDADRAGPRTADRAARHRLAARALILLTGAAGYDAAAARARGLLGPVPEGRLAAAWRMADEAAAGTADLLVNSARRYAWNHLRRPAPEAATPTHVRRSAELVRAFAPSTGDGDAG
ncbi:hypothetical protein [Micromonospora sp. RTGN7]|uniref:hypothetical protein n=1 Tax=Micromonospora sp. RTGN7 TaxID=3016526 RepID=UPI0029FF544A|nr:hypothetical protein [Micromonospora sp. RTGN7]